ncbi:unnamed protein product [Spirodela intermedia]|uniref:F-box domain-containing protein n=1 Tax=Spirodela intermedia TaxID=51605 RepID=A0A7I8JNP7_SPIIN|nr:unnamed protein product [Spirodela intermedia]CAA6671769.1 unnamed protein product [Spirodela intermedia]
MVTPPLASDLRGPRPPARTEEKAERDGREVDEEAADDFDRLPDSVLLLVFNRIGDVKALGRCSVVSRRFHGLVPHVEDVVVRVDCVISDEEQGPPGGSFSTAATTSASGSSHKPRGLFSHLARLVLSAIVKPLQAIRLSSFPAVPAMSPWAPSSPEVSHHSPTEVLRSFKEIRRLRIELPTGELGVEDGVLLKWKAGFGSTLDNCVILAANAILSSAKGPSTPPYSCGGGGDDNANIPESFYTNGSLKLRVVWTISSLIAASARHFLLQPIVADHGTLQNLDLTDADGQGLLRMDRAQLEELRVKPVSVSGSSQRTLVPALGMRLWYAQHLELPGGVALKGATLVAIQPSDPPGIATGDGWGQDTSWVSTAFDDSSRGEAARRRGSSREDLLPRDEFLLMRIPPPPPPPTLLPAARYGNPSS